MDTWILILTLYAGMVKGFFALIMSDVIFNPLLLGVILHALEEFGGCFFNYHNTNMFPQDY
jgi:hypothetical protein